MIDRLQLAWSALRHGTKALRITPTWGVGKPADPGVDYATLAGDGYSRNEVVFACIRLKATTAAEAPLKVMLDDETEAPPNHPLVALLNRPNDEMAQDDMLEALLTVLDIGGDSFWEIERARNGVPVQLHPMRNDRVKVIPGPFGIASYEYRVGNYEPVRLPAADVLHFRYFNPLSDYYGLPPLQVCARIADADNERSDYTRAFFMNAAVPYGLLKSKVKLNESEANRIRRRWQEEYSGDSNWHKVAVLDADAEYQRLSLTQTEMAFPDMTALAETRICSVFRVPPILVGVKAGLDKSTYSNYETARAAFWQDTMVPTLRKLEDTLNLHLAAEFGCKVHFDVSQVKALQEDRNAQIERAQVGLAGGWLTINEARQEAGFDVVPGGEYFVRNGMMVLVDAKAADAVAGAKPQYVAPEPTVDERDAEADAAADERVPPKREAAKALTAGEAKAKSRTDQIARAHERPFESMARRLFREDRDALLALLPAGKAARKDGALQVFWALAYELLTQRKEAWRGEFVPLFTAVIAEQAEAIEAQFGIAFDVRNPKVAEFIDSYTYKFLERTGATTNDALRELMLRADAEGMTVPELQTQLRELYDGWSETRAEQISRSETIRASNYGAREGYRQAGVRRIQWMTAQDDRLCEWCAPLNGKTVGIEEVYFHQGDVYSVADADGVAHDMKLDYEDVGAPPLHVACRCTIVPVIEDD